MELIRAIDETPAVNVIDYNTHNPIDHNDRSQGGIQMREQTICPLCDHEMKWTTFALGRADHDNELTIVFSSGSWVEHKHRIMTDDYPAIRKLLRSLTNDSKMIGIED